MALRAPHLHRMHPSTTAIAAIVFVTLVLSGFISYSVADGFNRYDEAIAVIRAQRLVLEDLLSQETSLQGYLDTGNRALLAPYRKSTATTAQDIDQLDRDIETLHLTMSDLLIDRIRETYREWDSNVKNLLLARPTADTFRQERLRRLMDSMRADLGRIQDEDRIFQDRVIRQVRLTVVGGSMALLLTIVLLGSLGIVAENARRRELHQLNVELDSRNQELERSNAALADFAYVASHDLQEPLRTVASYTQLLKKRYASELGIEGAEFVEFATNAAHRMERLINDLLEYSLVTMARTFENVESASALETAMHNLSVRIEEHRARVECSVLPPVFANPGQLAIVFQNLLSNGLKYHADEDPVIRIEAKPEGPQWLFSVSDNGIGIDPQHQDRIFKMFQRLHNRADYQGTGIGLALVKRIIELHGGRIWVESTPGGGSTFFFTVPGIV